MIPPLLPVAVSWTCPPPEAARKLPVYFLLHGDDPATRASLPFHVEVELLIRPKARASEGISFQWKGEWPRLDRDLVERLGEVSIPLIPDGEVPALEGILRSLKVVDSTGKLILRLNGKEGPLVEVGRKARALNFRVHCTWKADRLSLDVSLDTLE